MIYMKKFLKFEVSIIVEVSLRVVLKGNFLLFFHHTCELNVVSGPAFSFHVRHNRILAGQQLLGSVIRGEGTNPRDCKLTGSS